MVVVVIIIASTMTITMVCIMMLTGRARGPRSRSILRRAKQAQSTDFTLQSLKQGLNRDDP
jgi:hypothetical protein